MSARGPPPDWLSFLAALRPAHNDRADRPILRWQACRGQVNVKCSADILLAHRALPDAIHPLHRRRPVAPPATPELLCLSVAVADEIRFACLCATLVVLRQSLTVAPRNLNAYVRSSPALSPKGPPFTSLAASTNPTHYPSNWTRLSSWTGPQRHGESLEPPCGGTTHVAGSAVQLVEELAHMGLAIALAPPSNERIAPINQFQRQSLEARGRIARLGLQALHAIQGERSPAIVSRSRPVRNAAYLPRRLSANSRTGHSLCYAPLLSWMGCRPRQGPALESVSS